MRRAPSGSARAEQAAADQPPAGAAGAVAAIDPSRLQALLGYSLRRAYLRAHQRTAEHFRAHGVTATEFSVLVLIDSDRRANQRRLCDALAVSPPNMVGLLERLQGRGLIERRRDDGDRRTWLLGLTPRGARLARRIEQQLLAFEREALFPELTSAQRAQLQRLLHRATTGGKSKSSTTAS